MLREGPPQHAARVARGRLQPRQPRLVRLPRQLQQPVELWRTGLQPGRQAGIDAALLPVVLACLAGWRRLAHGEGQHFGLAPQVLPNSVGVGPRPPAAAGAAIHEHHKRHLVAPKRQAVVCGECG